MDVCWGPQDVYHGFWGACRLVRRSSGALHQSTHGRDFESGAMDSACAASKG